MIRILLSASALLLVACATAQGAQPGAAAKPVSKEEAAKAQALAQEGWVCEKVRPLGSNIMEEVCRPLADVERDREAARAMLRRPVVSPQSK